MYEIKCPYCESKKISYSDLIDVERNEIIERYDCDSCGEWFYVYTKTKEVEVSVSKEKYGDYKTIWKRNE